MTPTKRSREIRREQACERNIPYTAHVAPDVVRTRHGDYVQTFRLGGVSFETADDEQLNSWHERLNVLWRNIASPQLSLWTHIVRRRASVAAHAAGGAGFARELERRYVGKLAGETLMVN